MNLQLKYKLLFEKVLFYIKNFQISSVKIMDIDQTIEEIVRGEKSICRFGDGEMDQILGLKEGFQCPDAKLTEDLKCILSSKPDNCIICAPDAINSLKNLTDASLAFWLTYMKEHREDWLKYLSMDGYKYGTTNVSRCYLRYKNKKNCARWFDKLRAIWNDRDIVIVEGAATRIGVGNDFLDNAKSVKRIIAPSENAYSKIAYIKKSVIANVGKEELILMALGPTATVLAYQLSNMGYWCLDVGHCDIEYEWFRRGAKSKLKIPGKYTNEVDGGNEVSAISDQNYNDSIIDILN